jgi:hypothetical protein
LTPDPLTNQDSIDLLMMESVCMMDLGTSIMQTDRPEFLIKYP